jgi:ComF family protein
MLLRLTAAALNLVYPPYCGVCRSRMPLPLDWQERLALPAICNECCPLPLSPDAAEKEDALPCTHAENPAAPLAGPCLCCGAAAAVLSPDSRTCLVCSVFPPPFSQIRSCLPYVGKTKRAICSFKYGGQRSLAAYFGELLAGYLTGEPQMGLPFPQTDWELALPVPSSQSALRKRGFNHVGSVLKIMCRKTGIKPAVLVLRSSRVRRTQAGLALRERVSNVRNAFSASPAVEGKNILLVDDVITTGATAWDAARTILDAGAERVDLLTVARSPRFTANRIAAALHQRN